MIRILVCASSALALAGLESVVKGAADLEVVARQYDLDPALREAERMQADVVVVELPDASDPVSTIAAANAGERHGAALVVLTDTLESVRHNDLLRAGVRALLPRDATPQAILAAIRAAANNLVSLHADLAGHMQAPGVHPRVLDAPSLSLTARERHVLQMMADGLGNKSIAQRLGISLHTVKFHVGSIMSKLHATSRTEAVMLGIRQGLILL
ncbi:MAG: response regulator transcription factor [Candidatus Eremiobacteraeota bacterium]|nr:response regulator transcription factor [Candidatus Eremiobacteraeota bacterium]